MASIINHTPHIKNNLFLSIIITFYNQEKYVDKCLESVVKQKTQFQYEIIIIDDGSTDLTLDKIRKWANLYPELIVFDVMKRNNLNENQISRVSKCRLKGLEMASGRYLCFLDGDDYLPSTNKFEGQISTLERNNHCCACLSNYMSIIDGGKITIKSFSFSSRFHLKTYLLDYYVPAATMIYRNKFFSCYDDNFDDNSISFSLFSSGQVCFLNEITFCHFKTKDSSWQKKNNDEKIVAIIKNIDDATRFSCVKTSLIYKRHRQFIFELYFRRRELQKTYISQLRNLHSRLLKNIIYYKDINVFAKIYVKCSVIKLLLFSKFHERFRRKYN